MVSNRPFIKEFLQVQGRGSFAASCRTGLAASQKMEEACVMCVRERNRISFLESEWWASFCKTGTLQVNVPFHFLGRELRVTRITSACGLISDFFACVGWSGRLPGLCCLLFVIGRLVWINVIDLTTPRALPEVWALLLAAQYLAMVTFKIS